jgi:hypothetical protein
VPRRLVRHRFHDGWLDAVHHAASVTPAMAQTADVLIGMATWEDRKANRYGMTRERLAFWLRIKHEKNAGKRIKALRDAGWIVLCLPGHNGQQQVFHRSVPWDPVTKWSPTCGYCQFRHCPPSK